MKYSSLKNIFNSILYSTKQPPVQLRDSLYFNSCSTRQMKNVSVPTSRSVAVLDTGKVDLFLRSLLNSRCVRRNCSNERPCCASLRIHDTVSGTVCVPVSLRRGGSCNNFGKAAGARPIFAQTCIRTHAQVRPLDKFPGFTSLGKYSRGTRPTRLV